jgi:diacylglycerol kinase (ATP)
MTARRPILLVVNPASGGKLAAPAGQDDRERLDPDDLLAGLRARGMQVELHALAEDEDPVELGARAAREGRDVVAAGGDGTVEPIAAALVRTDATLGILPLGSWNNFATSLGIPAGLEDAMDVVARGRVAAVDVGLAWHPSTEEDANAAPPSDAERFFEAGGVGVDAEWFGAAQLAERYGLTRALRTAWRALRRRNAPMRLVVDGTSSETQAPAAIVSNGPYLGMGFAIAPDADVADGMLDLVVFRGMSRWAVLRHLIAVARRRPRSEPRAVRIKARRIVIHGSRRTLPAHVDGRSMGTTPVAFALDPGALRIFR